MRRTDRYTQPLPVQHEKLVKQKEDLAKVGCSSGSRGVD